MARKSGSDKVTKSAAEAPSETTPRARIVAALMTLAAEERWADIAIRHVAERAHVSLAEFRDLFPSKGAVLAAFARQIDRIVLEGTDKDLEDESAKDRLFDVLMRRLDALQPYREALRNIQLWARGDPLAAGALNQVAVNSMRFMLEAAGIDSEGPVGPLKLQGLALAWLRIIDVWLDDDDIGLARTMAALDRELTRGGRIVARAEDFERLTAPLRSLAMAVFRTGRQAGGRVRERYRRSGPDADREDSVP
jgi:AcrR family transcriptional regulator